MKNASDLINQISNSRQLGVGRAFYQGNGMHGCAGHAEAFEAADARLARARFSEAATRPAGSRTSLTRPSPLTVAPARPGQRCRYLPRGLMTVDSWPRRWST